MILTRSSEYAIELVLYLLSNKSRDYYPLNVVADDTGLSFHYLSKIARSLIRNGILTSCRGPKGGVALARQADQITLNDVVSTIEGVDVFGKCIIRPERCNEDEPCPVHSQWLPIRERLQHLFLETTMDQFYNINKLPSGAEH